MAQGTLEFPPVAPSSVSAPAAGYYRFFVGNGTEGTTLGTYYRKDSTGAVVSIVPPAFSAEDAQDAIGALLADSNTLDFTYDDAGNVETADVRVPISSSTGASRVYTTADHGKYVRRSNGGAAMTDTLPTTPPNGYYVKVQNLGTTTAETITFSLGAGATIGELGATSYVLKYGCRQTFVYDAAGNRWSFDAGNGNLLKNYTGATPGDILTVLDSAAVGVAKASPAQLAAAQNLRLFQANVVDYGADMTGATASDTALTNAIASLPSGGLVIIPAGVLLLTGAPYIVSGNNIRLQGAGSNATTIKTNATTGDQLRLTGYGCSIHDLTIQGPGSGTTSSKTSGIGLDIQSTEGYAGNINFSYQYDCLALNGSLVDADDLFCRYFTHNGINVSHNSDHRISRVTMDNAVATLPTGAGISVTMTASLLLRDLNIIHSNVCLDIAPASGVTVPSVKAVNCFFDTSAYGVRMASAGAWFRSEFTNCWFSSMSIAGIAMTPAAGGSCDGITFVNCDIYNNVAGTTSGILTNSLTGKWKMVGSSIAGWTTGINLVAGTAHFPTIISNTIGAVSAFSANTTGIAVAAGTYKGLVLQSNDVVDNTTAMTGAPTITANGALFRIIDNPGINPKGAVTTPTFPASGTAVTNLTGYRVLIGIKGGTSTAVAVNGVASVYAVTPAIVTLEPGGTVAITYSIAPTWVWVGQ